MQINSILAFLYLVTGCISFSFEQTSSIVTLAVFIPEGIALGAVLIYGKRVVPGIFIGQFLLSYTTGIPLIISLFIAITNSFEALLAYKISKKFKIRISAKKPTDTYKLFGMIFFVLQPFSAFFGNLALLFGGIVKPEMFDVSVLSWWFGNVMGQLLITPVLLFVYSALKENNFKAHYTVVIFAVLMVVFFFVGVLPIQNMAILMSFTIPLVMLTVNYLGIEYAAVSVLLIAFFTMFEKIFGVNIFVGDSIHTVINTNFFIVAHITIAYTYGILQQQKQRALKKAELLNRSLACKVEKELRKSREKDKFLLYKSRLAQMGEMINMIAHQWRQPLNVISMLNQALILKHKKGVLDEIVLDEFSKKFNEQVGYMSQTIDDFRDFFKPEKQKRDFELNTTVRKAISMVQKSFEKEKITLEYEEDVPHAVVHGYPNEFSQVVINILNNAKDALAKKEQERKIVSVHIMMQDKQYALCIEDNGGGIKQEYLEKIFEPYFSTKEQQYGTGLGLYICNMIIEEHMHGQITVSNVQNDGYKGAKFCIYLKREEKYG